MVALAPRISIPPDIIASISLYIRTGNTVTRQLNKIAISLQSLFDIKLKLIERERERERER